MAFDPTSAFLDEDDTQPATTGAFDPSTAGFDASTASEDFESDQGVLGTLKQGTKSAARAIGAAIAALGVSGVVWNGTAKLDGVIGKVVLPALFAPVVAQALANQKLVLDQITALNTTTANIIDGTSKMLKDNTARIHEQAANSTIPLETLSRAFQNIYDTMDSIDTFKMQALDSMKQTVQSLEGEVTKSKAYIARAQGQAEGASSGDGKAAKALLEALD